jgi:hypothetical protein
MQELLTRTSASAAAASLQHLRPAIYEKSNIYIYCGSMRHCTTNGPMCIGLHARVNNLIKYITAIEPHTVVYIILQMDKHVLD